MTSLDSDKNETNTPNPAASDAAASEADAAAGDAASAGTAAGNAAAADKDSLFIGAVQGHQKRYRRIVEFTHSSTKAAAVMLVAAIVALIIANTGAREGFEEAIHTAVGFVVGDTQLTMSISHVINDLFMALFFLLVGLEVKYEMTVGELTNIRAALLPVIAAVGGVAMPVVVYLLFNASSPETAGGWGIPTATDIAFALGIMALLGDRIPGGIRVFLSTLAVADDIIAILVIAIFYGHAPDLMCLLGAAVVLAALILLNRAHVYALAPYLLLGVVLWTFVYLSGVHATIAGVLLAFTIPSGSRVNLREFAAWSDKKVNQATDALEPEEPVIAQKEYLRNVRNLSAVSRQVIPPATRLENGLYPWVYFVILPLFALTNANVHISGDLGAIVASPGFLGVFFGLLAGKPMGILLASAIVVKSGLGALPAHTTWRHMAGAALLGGVGFTMAIFVSNLAFDSEAATSAAKLAILMASAVAGIAGFAVLMPEAKRAVDEDTAYLRVGADGSNLPHDEREEEREYKRALADMDDECRAAWQHACEDDEPHELCVKLRSK
ncbi:MAG: Na+/H+ antiporter NhaA [Eggerthellaceae bacterium]